MKHATNISMEKYKAHFMEKEPSQKDYIHYEETSTPIARYSSIWTIFSLVAKMGWCVHQMDIKTAFLNGVIEEVYIEQLEGFVMENMETHVCRLH